MAVHHDAHRKLAIMMRAAMVDHLAEAYRHKGRSGYADLIIENRHLDYTPEECRAALGRALVEVDAVVVILEEMRRVIDGGVS